MITRSWIAKAAAVALLGSAAAFGPTAAQAHQAPLHQTVKATQTSHLNACKRHHITARGGAVSYWECHRTHKGKKQSSTQIWVYDKKNDGKCVYARVKIAGWKHTYKACPKNHDVSGSRSGWHNGRDAQVRMSIK